MCVCVCVCVIDGQKFWIWHLWLVRIFYFFHYWSFWFLTRQKNKRKLDHFCWKECNKYKKKRVEMLFFHRNSNKWNHEKRECFWLKNSLERIFSSFTFFLLIRSFFSTTYWPLKIKDSMIFFYFWTVYIAFKLVFFHTHTVLIL